MWRSVHFLRCDWTLNGNDSNESQTQISDAGDAYRKEMRSLRLKADVSDEFLE